MNATVHTAYVLDTQRAVELARQNEITRSQRERAAEGDHSANALAAPRLSLRRRARRAAYALAH